MNRMNENPHIIGRRSVPYMIPNWHSFADNERINSSQQNRIKNISDLIDGHQSGTYASTAFNGSFVTQSVKRYQKLRVNVNCNPIPYYLSFRHLSTDNMNSFTRNQLYFINDKLMIRSRNQFMDMFMLSKLDEHSAVHRYSSICDSIELKSFGKPFPHSIDYVIKQSFDKPIVKLQSYDSKIAVITEHSFQLFDAMLAQNDNQLTEPVKVPNNNQPMLFADFKQNRLIFCENCDHNKQQIQLFDINTNRLETIETPQYKADSAQIALIWRENHFEEYFSAKTNKISVCDSRESDKESLSIAGQQFGPFCSFNVSIVNSNQLFASTDHQLYAFDIRYNNSSVSDYVRKQLMVSNHNLKHSNHFIKTKRLDENEVILICDSEDIVMSSVSLESKDSNELLLCSQHFPYHLLAFKQLIGTNRKVNGIEIIESKRRLFAIISTDDEHLFVQQLPTNFAKTQTITFLYKYSNQYVNSIQRFITRNYRKSANIAKLYYECGYLML